MKLGRRFLWLALLLAAPLGHAGATNLEAKLAVVSPFPSVCAAADACGISLAGMDSPTNSDGLVPGDSVTSLVTLREKGRRPTQWLLCFQASTNPPPKPMAKPRHAMVLYSSTGHRYEFARSPATIRVRVLGPFLEPNPRRRGQASYEDHSTQVSVDGDFLSLGLDGGAAAILRWAQAAVPLGDTNFMKAVEVAHRPYNSERTNHDAKLAARWQVTPAEERAVAAWDPALQAYFSTVGETPNLRDMLWKVLSLPSLWSFIKNRGVDANFWLESEQVDRVALTGWGLPGEVPVYSLPSLLTINKHRALRVTMLATNPRQPLLVCGGVVGFLAENPDVEDNFLTLRILSAHGHSGSPKTALAQKVE